MTASRGPSVFSGVSLGRSRRPVSDLHIAGASAVTRVTPACQPFPERPAAAPRAKAPDAAYDLIGVMDQPEGLG